MSTSTSSEALGKEAEIFDRLFQLDEEDIGWIKRRINRHIAACKRYASERPPRWREALREANEASTIAFAEGMTGIDSKINFYIAYCYKGMGMWREAYQFYMNSTVDNQDIYWLQGLQSLSRQKMEAMELRRNYGPFVASRQSKERFISTQPGQRNDSHERAT
ncbi:hypothetical protein THAR02_08423 [Trichoderma harzianum]|uniref:Uncharacterized protein n=1 Tax=Trichoderma harzianum TaxID=5544 RepID=A0A0F9X4C6_TRIHA|nr:hypothetical protein THAR02_08423 [Trichoderma harzianum]